MKQMKQLTLMMMAAVFAAFPAFAASVAVPGERADVVRIEVAAKDPNAKGERLFGRDKDGNAPIHKAAREGNARQVRHYLISGENPDVQNNIGRTPLHYAVQFALTQQHFDVIRELISRDANMNVREEYGKTPLHFAAGITGNRESIAILADAGAEIDARDIDGKTPLHWAVSEVKVDTVNALLARGADENAKDKDGKTPLLVAVYDARNGDIVASLVRAGADNAFVNQPIIAARNADTPLHWAVRTKDAELAQMLVIAGADINKRTADNLTPLHAAALHNAPKVAKVLIDSGADLNGRTGDNFTPLHMAALHNASKVAKVLIDSGADLHVRTNNGRDRAMDIAISKHGHGSEIADTIGYPTTDADAKWEASLSWADWYNNCLKHHWKWVCDWKATSRKDSTWEWDKPFE